MIGVDSDIHCVLVSSRYHLRFPNSISYSPYRIDNCYIRNIVIGSYFDTQYTVNRVSLWFSMTLESGPWILLVQCPCHHVNFMSRLRTDTDNLKAELAWASSRPGSRWKHSTTKADDEGSTIPDVANEDAFQDCFTEWELNAYTDYVQKKRDSVYSMNQDPTQRATYATGQVPGCQVSVFNQSFFLK